MRSLEQKQITTNLSGHLFTRVDPSSAVILYSGSCFKKGAIGYYYFTRIAWQLYEIVGETQDGLFSCIFSAPKSTVAQDPSLVGTLRYGRQQLGRVRVMHKNDGAPFVTFHAIGSTDCLIAESRGHDSRSTIMVHSEFGEILKIDGSVNRSGRFGLTRGCVRIGEFLQPIITDKDVPALRVIVLATASAILSHNEFELPARIRF